jgi:hypothetical protein
MHHRHHHRRGRIGSQRPFPNRLELLARLESYQRDLEQELADIDDVIRHLRGNGDGGEAPTAQATGEV